MFHGGVQKNAKYIGCLLIGFLFCAIIWTSDSPKSAAAAMGKVDERLLLIIDPGHGGEDGGAVSHNGTVESGINLDIALRMRDLCHFLGIRTVMTRESETLDYPESARTTAQRKRWDTQRRVEIINSHPEGILVSIHQNIYPTAAPSGSQVLYGAGETSREVGTLLHNSLIQVLNPQNRRVATPANPDIYVMAHARCTAVLVECGFLSHPEESALLGTDSYKIKIAMVLAGTLLGYWEDTNESEDSFLLHGMRQ